VPLRHFYNLISPRTLSIRSTFTVTQGDTDTICPIVLVTMSVEQDGNDIIQYPQRQIRLTRENDSIPIGRASQSTHADRRAAEGNALFSARVVSKNHAEMKANFDNNTVFIRDVENKHGTFLNGEMLQSPMQVHHGDQLRFGAQAYDKGATFAATTLNVGLQFRNDTSKPFTVVVPDDEASDVVDEDSTDEEYDDDDDEVVVTSSVPLVGNMIDLTQDNCSKVLSSIAPVSSGAVAPAPYLSGNGRNSDIIDLEPNVWGEVFRGNGAGSSQRPLSIEAEDVRPMEGDVSEDEDESDASTEYSEDGIDWMAQEGNVDEPNDDEDGKRFPMARLTGWAADVGLENIHHHLVPDEEFLRDQAQTMAYIGASSEPQQPAINSGELPQESTAAAADPAVQTAPPHPAFSLSSVLNPESESPNTSPFFVTSEEAVPTEEEYQELPDIGSDETPESDDNMTTEEDEPEIRLEPISSDLWLATSPPPAPIEPAKVSDPEAYTGPSPLLASGQEFLSSPPPASMLERSLEKHRRYDYDGAHMLSAHAFQTHKDNAKRTEIGIHDLVIQSPSEPPSRKRKAGGISEVSPLEEVWAKQTSKATSKTLDASHLAVSSSAHVSAKATANTDQHRQDTYTLLRAQTSHARPAKRMRIRSILEKVGYAALGGAAVGAAMFSSLVLTAPNFS
jgi:pSer/pThr/pTyr-binding forkhead associated (FHA) protein